MTEVSIEKLTKDYGQGPAVNAISLKIAEGEFISLLGPSGCGKTTTLKMIAGFEDATAGAIRFDGRDVVNVAVEKRDIGMVFQNYALFPHMTVEQNLAFGLEMRKIPKPQIREKIARVLDMVQLKGFAERYPRQLSGGQQQRVALARALVIEPKILLLDEPLANLDAKLREEMRVFIRDLQRRVGITTVYVTHDQAEAMTMSDRVVVMFGGRIAQIGTPSDIYERPANLEVAEFVGQVNIVRGKLNNGVVSTAFGDVPVASGQADGAELMLALRPEAVELLPAGASAGGVPAKVLSSYYSGSLVDYRLELAGGATVNVQTFPRTRFADGEQVLVHAPADRFWPLGSAAWNAAPAKKGLGPLLLIAPAAVLIGVFLVLPYLNIVVMSFRMPGQGTPYGPGFTFGNYGKFFADSFYIGQVVNTLWIGFLTTFLCLILGFPVAWQLARGNSAFRAVGYGLVLSPLLVGIVIRSYGWTILLGNNGIINRTLSSWGLIDGPLPLMYNALGIIIALVHVFLPFMILPIMSAIQGIDPSLESAARSLGASKLTAFRRITLPLSLPGIQAGCILVFVLSLSAYVTPSLIGGLRVKTMAVTVVDALIDTFQWPFGSAMALMLSITGAVVVIIFGRLTVMKWKA